MKHLIKRARASRAWVAAILLSLGGAQFALADGPSAVHNLFSNLARAKASLGGVNKSTAALSPTLVKGIYAIHQQGRFIGYTNEAGTLFGDSRGFSVLSADGAAPRQMSPSEVAELRREVMARVDYDRLVKVPYGNGGGRKLLMFSAVDCVHCKAFEESMAQAKAQVDTTFYVVPSSLATEPLGQGWQIASHIWCSDDKGSAWVAYWTRHAMPRAAGQCEFEPRAAARAYNDLISVFKAVGVRIVGTPTVVREDGALVPTKDRFDGTTAKAVFGEQAAPHAPVDGPVRWLAGSAGDASQASGANAAPSASEPTVRVSAGDLLKKALSR